MWWPGPVIPPGWKECNGEILLIADYSDLNTALGTNTYKWQYELDNSAYTVPGNGAFNASLHFQLPDLRGEFIRGLDNSRGVDTGRGGVRLKRINSKTTDILVFTRPQAAAFFGSPVGEANITQVVLLELQLMKMLLLTLIEQEMKPVHATSQ